MQVVTVVAVGEVKVAVAQNLVPVQALAVPQAVAPRSKSNVGLVQLGLGCSLDLLVRTVLTRRRDSEVERYMMRIE